ncbi:hypothetical protein LCGC14_0564800, partial [marine sediment metagenome]
MGEVRIVAPPTFNIRRGSSGAGGGARRNDSLGAGITGAATAIANAIQQRAARKHSMEAYQKKLDADIKAARRIQEEELEFRQENFGAEADLARQSVDLAAELGPKEAATAALRVTAEQGAIIAATTSEAAVEGMERMLRAKAEVAADISRDKGVRTRAQAEYDAIMDVKLATASRHLRGGFELTTLEQAKINNAEIRRLNGQTQELRDTTEGVQQEVELVLKNRGRDILLKHLPGLRAEHPVNSSGRERKFLQLILDIRASKDPGFAGGPANLLQVNPAATDQEVKEYTDFTLRQLGDTGALNRLRFVEAGDFSTALQAFSEFQDRRLGRGVVIEEDPVMAQARLSLLARGHGRGHANIIKNYVKQLGEEPPLSLDA